MILILSTLLPPGVIPFLGLIAAMAILWYCVKFIPEPVAQLKWLAYVILLLIVAWWIWTRTQG